MECCKEIRPVADRLKRLVVVSFNLVLQLIKPEESHAVKLCVDGRPVIACGIYNTAKTGLWGVWERGTSGKNWFRNTHVRVYGALVSFASRYPVINGQARPKNLLRTV